jgi:hypothetical protein
MIRRLTFRSYFNKDNDKIIGKHISLLLRNYYCPKLHSEKSSCTKKLSYSSNYVNLSELNKRLTKNEKTINLLFCEFQKHQNFVKNELSKMNSSSSSLSKKDDNKGIFIHPDV